MPYEVEMKFPVADMAALESRLAEASATISEPRVEADLYFAHPARDFMQTDEAFRIRRKGTANFLTYKGPKLDRETKTRQEIDLELPQGEDVGPQWIAMLEALGFRPVAEVRKSRRKAFVEWQGRRVEGSLDQVEGVGTYAELELVVEEDELDAAKACIRSLAEHLGLADSERRSYLELLLSQ